MGPIFKAGSSYITIHVYQNQNGNQLLIFGTLKSHNQCKITIMNLTFWDNFQLFGVGLVIFNGQGLRSRFLIDLVQ